ncbi:MAG: hypothetical protein HRF49_11515, partial [bacterium]
SASYDPDGTIVSYDWNFDGGLWDLEGVGPVQEHTYTVPYPTTTATVKVWDSEGAIAEKSVVINVHGWYKYYVDTGPNVGGGSSICILGNGQPAVAYFDDENDDLKFVSASSGLTGDWNQPLTLDSEGDVGRYCSLSLIAGKPSVAYADSTNSHIKFIKSSDEFGGEWGMPHFIPTGEPSLRASLVEVGGLPAIAFRFSESKVLGFARAINPEGSDWNGPVVVDPQFDSGYLASMQIVNGNPAVAYFNLQQERLKYIRALDQLGNQWGDVITLDDQNDAWRMLSFCVIDSKPSVAYADAANEYVWFTSSSDLNGSTWKVPQQVSRMKSFSWLALGSIKQEPFVFCEFAPPSLNLIIANSGEAGSWGSPISFDSGQADFHPSFAYSTELSSAFVSYKGGYYQGSDSDLKVAVFR